MQASKRRKNPQLSESLLRQLNLYSLCATAAGVGVLTFPPSAEAKIVYTRVHRLIDKHETFRLDLNHDGVADFTLRNYTYCNTDQCFYKLVEQAAPGNSVEGISRGSFQPLASALSGGARIGNAGRFYGNKAILAYAYYGGGGSFASGKWVNVTNRYLGLRFQIKGKTHFGWARLSVQVNKTVVTSTITGYAYENVPGKAILAGQTLDQGDVSAAIQEQRRSDAFKPRRKDQPLDTLRPASLAALALGAPSLWRREESMIGPPDDASFTA